jgi:type VI secretion system protein ImpF
VAELIQKERLQPSLLDRLADDEPGTRQESREKRVLSLRNLREAVLRDLTWLLNAGNLEAAEDLSAYPLVAQSVVNFGLPELAGNTASSIDVIDVERLLRKVIVDFEPRILRNSLKVRAVLDEAAMSHNSLVFEIEGELWAQPLPLHLFLRTQIDLEGGGATLREGGRGAG